MPKTGKRTEEIEWDGQTITRPGIYAGIPMEKYHSGDLCDGPSISSSGLRILWNEAPAYYWDKSPYNPDREEESDNENFILGRAAHHVFLGERHFKTLFVMRPDQLPHYKTGEMRNWHGNNTECKEWIERQKKTKLTVLSGAQVEAIKGMALALGIDPAVKQGVLNGRVERSYIWKDRETGVWLKWRPDNTPNDSLDFVDLKTTHSALDRDVSKTLDDNSYQQQGALGNEACMALLGQPMASFSLLFVEKTRPFQTRFMSIKDEDLARGAKMNRVALRKFWKCFKEKTWPGPRHHDFEWLELSDRAKKRIDDQLLLEGIK